MLPNWSSDVMSRRWPYLNWDAPLGDEEDGCDCASTTLQGGLELRLMGMPAKQMLLLCLRIAKAAVQELLQSQGIYLTMASLHHHTKSYCMWLAKSIWSSTRIVSKDWTGSNKIIKTRELRDERTKIN